MFVWDCQIIGIKRNQHSIWAKIKRLEERCDKEHNHYLQALEAFMTTYVTFSTETFTGNSGGQKYIIASNIDIIGWMVCNADFMQTNVKRWRERYLIKTAKLYNLHPESKRYISSIESIFFYISVKHKGSISETVIDALNTFLYYCKNPKLVSGLVLRTVSNLLWRIPKNGIFILLQHSELSFELFKICILNSCGTLERDLILPWITEYYTDPAFRIPRPCALLTMYTRAAWIISKWWADISYRRQGVTYKMLESQFISATTT